MGSVHLFPLLIPILLQDLLLILKSSLIIIRSVPGISSTQSDKRPSKGSFGWVKIKTGRFFASFILLI